MKSIHINLQTTAEKSTGTVEKKLHTYIHFDKETTFEGLQRFRRDAKKIFRQAIKAANAGDTYEYSVTLLIYKNSHELESERCESWFANSEDDVGEDDNGKEYIHLSPDPKYTEDYWDMCMYADVMDSLAEAHV